MGWNKRATRKLYDSIPGHGFMICYHTEKVIDYLTMNKKRSVRRSANMYNANTPDHECTINWTGSSSAMESGAARILVTTTALET